MLIVDFSYFCHCAANRRTAIRGVYGARTVRRVVISLVIFFPPLSQEALSALRALVAKIAR